MNNLVKRGVYLPDFFDALWNDAALDRAAGAGLPAVNVRENAKELAVDLSVPGFAEKDVSVEVDDNVLTIAGRHEEEKDAKDAKDRVLRQEFTSSAFSRSFTLPKNIDTEKIQAKLDQGVLKLTLPKKNDAPENKKKKIAVK